MRAAGRWHARAFGRDRFISDGDLHRPFCGRGACVLDLMQRLGWNFSRQQELEQLNQPLYQPARVAVEHRGGYGLIGCGVSAGKLSGRLRHLADVSGRRPCVGDWVAVRPGRDAATIEAILSRKTLLSRRQAGGALQEQVVAANVDLVFVVTSANGDFNLRRLERYLATVWSSGAQPLLVLSKTDVCESSGPFIHELAKVAHGAPIVATSAATGLGLQELRACILPGATAAMIGSSGVGKSSLLNALLGQNKHATREIRAADEKGRHATTRRELVELAEGCLIDTPGMREVGLWDAAVGTQRAFEEVEALAQTCRFSDCRHASEPGCAVRMAAEVGVLDLGRLANYERLQREQTRLEAQYDLRAREQAKQRTKSIHKQRRARSKVDPKLRED